MGNALANSITGGRGDDSLIGGAGNDTYVFDTRRGALGSDTLDESGGGVDTLDFYGPRPPRRSASTWGWRPPRRSTPISTLTLSSASTFENVIGGWLGDTITGNALANILTGGAGNDTLAGGAGNDTYVFDTDVALGSDTLDESGGGNDTLDFSGTTTRAISINLGLATAQVANANLTLTLGLASTFENVIGGSLGDTLTGNALANRLTGGPGNDTLTGGAGNDVYVLDADVALGSDTLNESGGGIDTLDFSTTGGQVINVNLGQATAQVVNGNLTLTLSSAATFENVIGGWLGDTIVGNALANSITGGRGDDSLIGGAGNDTYVFDTDVALGSDTLDESGGGVDSLDFYGTTTQTVSVNLGLATVQAINGNLALTLSSASTFENVTGGWLGDTITGNALANTLTGGDGNDTLIGGAGNDVYLFDTDVALGSDTLDESAGGNDTLDFSGTTTRAISINLGLATAQAVNANLTLTLGSATTFENVIGGSLGDTLTGNALANRLTGGPGNDILTGGAGNDVYVLDADVALGSDTLDESGGGIDTLDFSTTGGLRHQY